MITDPIKTKLTEKELEEFARKSVMDDDLFCPYCNSRIHEPDYGTCHECGNKNPLTELGF